MSSDDVDESVSVSCSDLFLFSCFFLISSDFFSLFLIVFISDSLELLHPSSESPTLSPSSSKSSSSSSEESSDSAFIPSNNLFRCSLASFRFPDICIFLFIF